MKGKLTKAMMVAMMLVTVFGLAASLVTVSTTAVVSADTDKWSRMDLPTTLHFQMLPDSDIWDLTAADDGTLFALVEDTTGDDFTNTEINPPDVDIADGGAMVWDGLRWAVHPAYSDVAVFKSTDGGYTWELTWHIPATETGAPIAIVPQPNYVDTDASNDVVFVATGSRYIVDRIGDTGGATAGTLVGGAGTGNIYRSTDAGDNFTRITPRCPGVTTSTALGTITCLDVAKSSCCGTGCPVPYMAIVGVSSLGAGGTPADDCGEGIYTWNENGVAIWQDKSISNAIQFVTGGDPPVPGTMPASNGLDVLAVLASPNYENDGQIIAVVNDIEETADPAGMGIGIYTCFYDALDGFWGGDVDSPTNAITTSGAVTPSPVAPWDGNLAQGAAIAVGADYSASSAWVFVSIYGTGALADDVYRVRGLSTVTGPSRVAALHLGLYTGGLGALWIDDLTIPGNADTAIYAACEFPGAGVWPQGQAQVFKCENATLWGSWTPSFKPPSGASPVFVTGNLFAGGGSERLVTSHTAGAARLTTTSGVSKMVDTPTRGPVYNGVGLLDDIAVSEDIPGYNHADGPVSSYRGTWCLAEAVAEDVSPTYATDGLIYIATDSDWAAFDSELSAPSASGQLDTGLSLWRLTNGKWERIMFEGIVRPYTYGSNYEVFSGMAMNINTDYTRFVDEWTWVPKVVPQFSTDGSMFLLGGVDDTRYDFPGSYQEWLWYSPDKGDAWSRVPQMPVGAIQYNVASLSELGWCVVDSNVLFMGDDEGWIYRTTNRGAAWTDGALTGAGLEIHEIKVSPIFSMTGAAGTDQVLIAGTFEEETGEDEVWISEDAAVNDLENIGDEIYTMPYWTRPNADYGTTAGQGDHTWDLIGIGGTVVAFDKNWATNHIVYAAARGWMDEWTLVGQGAGGTQDLNRVGYSDVCVARTEVDLSDPSASTWEHLWDANGWNSVAPKPQPYPGMTIDDVIYRMVAPTEIQIATDGTVYVTYSVWDESYNADSDSQTPKYNPVGGRFTYSGILRCLNGAAETTEWNTMRDGLGPWDGLVFNRVVPGNNHAISLTWDWKEWRFKLAFWEDTLSGAGPASVAPADGATGVGVVVSDTSVNVPLSWQAKGGASKYEWQVSEDEAFTAPKSGTTSALEVTVLDLKADTTYFWRVRALEPMIGNWGPVQQFATAIGGETGAPQLISPAIGSTITDDTPMFTWSRVASQTNYRIQVATDAAFGSADIVIDEQLGDVQGFVVASGDALENGDYFWRVKATNADNDTETPWSEQGSFTLDTAAGGQGTPVWVWVLIVCGILLAIIVLVLILRTRRPV